MPADYIDLSWWQLALAASLMVISAGVSLALRLGLHWRLALATTRTIAQLLLLGLVLRWIFEATGTVYVVAVVVLLLVMTLVAGVAAVRRTERQYPGLLLDSILAIWASGWISARWPSMASCKCPAKCSPSTPSPWWA
jgi:putative ABC transport system permease protein